MVRNSAQFLAVLAGGKRALAARTGSTAAVVGPGLGACASGTELGVAAGTDAVTTGAGAGAGAVGGLGDEQLTTPKMSVQLERLTQARRQSALAKPSMQDTINFLSQVMRNAFHRFELGHAGRCDAAHAAEALQQPGPLLGANAGNVLKPA